MTYPILVGYNPADIFSQVRSGFLINNLFFWVEDKGMVTLEIRRCKVKVEAKVTDEVPPGLLLVPFHFADSPANVPTNPALDPGCKCAETKVCSVRVEVR